MPRSLRGGRVPRYHKASEPRSRLPARLSGGLSGGLLSSARDYAQLGATRGAEGALFAALSDVGRGLAQQQRAEEQVAVAARFARSKRAVDEALHGAALRHEEDTAAFAQQATTLRAQWLAQLPEAEQAEAALYFDSQAATHAAEITAKEHQREKEADNADLIAAQEATSAQALTAWFAGDTPRAQALDETLVQWVSARSDLSEQQKQRLALKHREAAQDSRFRGELKRVLERSGLAAAEDFLQAVQNNEGLSLVERDRLSHRLEADLEDARTDRRLALAALHAEARLAVETLTQGRPFKNLEELRARAQALGDADSLSALQEAETLSDIAAAFVLLPPAQMAATLAKQRQAGVENAFDNKRLDLYEGLYHQALQGLREQPLAWVEQSGVRALAPLDLTDPTSLARRVQEGEWVRERFGLRETPLLKAQEADQLKAALAQATATEKTALLVTLTSGFGAKHLPAVLASVSQSDPVFAQAGVIGQQDPQAARTIIEGQEIRKFESQYLPTRDEDYREDYKGALPPEVLRGFSPELTKGIEETVLSAYAALARKAGATSKKADADRLEEAVRLVTGGVVEYNDFKTLAPVRGMSDDHFADLLESLTDANLGAVYLPAPGKTSGGRLTAEDLRNHAELIAQGPGRYAVEIQGQRALTATGESFILDLSHAPEAPSKAPHLNSGRSRDFGLGGAL